MEYFDKIVQLLSDNIEWLFSGIGVFLLALFFSKGGVSKKQKAGRNSNNYMADRDISIGAKDDNK